MARRPHADRSVARCGHPAGLPRGERLLSCVDRVGCGGAPSGDAGREPGTATEHGPPGPRAASWFPVVRPGEDRFTGGFIALP
jgi:hypothetical protein